MRRMPRVRGRPRLETGAHAGGAFAMNFDMQSAIAVLERTPSVLRSCSPEPLRWCLRLRATAERCEGGR
jgi:hypothetical protein